MTQCAQNPSLVTKKDGSCPIITLDGASWNSTVTATVMEYQGAGRLLATIHRVECNYEEFDEMAKLGLGGVK